MLFESAGIIMTNRCNARCEMCCFKCSPENTGVFSEEQLIYTLNELFENNIKRVGFTGGEVMLYPQLLDAGIKHAKSYGMEYSVTTNGFWAKDYNNCVKILKKLYEYEVSYVSVSIDENHLEYISIDCYRNIIKANRGIGAKLKFSIGDSLNKVRAVDIIRKLGGDIYGQALNIYPFYPVGRGREIAEEKQALDKYNPHWHCAYQRHCAVFYDGDFKPCCSPAMADSRMGTGNVFKRKLREIISDYEDCGIFSTLLRQGFDFYMQIAKKENYNIGNKFISPCHLCSILFSDKQFADLAEPYVQKEYAEHAYKMFTQSLLEGEK